jgi:hypothetical protein
MTIGRNAGGLQAVRWWVTWGVSILVVHLLGVLVNALAMAVDFLDVATKTHGDTSARGIIDNYIVGTLFIVVLLAFPLVIALAVLWFVGPWLNSRRFRILSFVMFLWYAPFVVLFYGSTFHPYIWLITSVVIAAVIRLPSTSQR